MYQMMPIVDALLRMVFAHQMRAYRPTSNKGATDMLTLYYAPGGCSLSPHIALREARIPFKLRKVDFMRGKKLEDGRDFAEVSPKAYIPALVLEDGQLLTEGAVIAQYIADRAPEAKLAPPPGTFERVRLQEWLNFIATELHKGLGPLFAQNANAEYKTSASDKFAGRLALLAKGLEGKTFLMGDQFTIADGYAFYALRSWQVFFKNELTGALLDYYSRISARPAVQATLEAEGFTKGS
jgi:glutathione S-transferase